jgi:hypothetical protein
MLRGSSITPTDAPAGDSGQPNSVEGYSALESAARNRRISETLLQSLTAQDVFQFLVSKIPTLRSFEQVWTFSGADLISIDPKVFVRALQIEYPSLPFSAGVEVYKLVQQKILSDVSISEGQPSNLSVEVVQNWSDTPVPTFQQALNASPNFANQDQFVPDFATLSRLFPNFMREWQASPSFPNQFQGAANGAALPNVSNQFPNVSNQFPNVSNQFPNVSNQVQGVSNVPNFSKQFQGVSNVPSSSALLPNSRAVAGFQTDSPIVPTTLNNLFSTPLEALSSADVCLAIVSACENATRGNRGFQWPAITFDGNFILQSTPSTFNDRLNAEVPNLSAAQSVTAAVWVRNQILNQSQCSPVPVNPELLRRWTNMPRGFPIYPEEVNENVFVRPPPPNQFTATSSKSTKFMIGGPRSPFQNSNAANVPSQLFPNYSALFSNQAAQINGQTAASAAQIPHFISPMAASAAQTLNGPMAASAAQTPQIHGQTAASAAQNPLIFGQTAASAAQMPQISATPLYTHMQTGASASLLSPAFSNPSLSQILHTVQARSRGSKPVMPWEAVALVSNPFVQDPSLPKGFKRLSVTKIVEAARLKRAQTPAHIDMSKLVKYPVMSAFRPQDFFETRKAYVAAIKSSTISGMFNSFKSCLSVTAQNAAVMVFRLSEDRFIELDDDTFMKWCALKFGPSNKKEALKLLKGVKMYHSDNEHDQSEFVEKFDQVCYDFEMVVNDIVDSQDKWPFDAEDIECSGLTLKEIMKEWKEIFPKQEGARIFSVQLKKCRAFIEQNLEMPFNEQVLKLRNYFANKDQEVVNGEGKYSTEPRIKPNKSGYGQSKFRRFGVSAIEHDVDVSALAGDSKRFDKRQRGGGQAPKSKFPKRVVAGSERGLACGSLNNHMGLGCTKNTCPVFGTEHDMSRDKRHVWKSSDMEDSVHMPNDEWNQRLKDNPKILENWKKARHDQRDRKGKVKVSALNTAMKEESESEDEPSQEVFNEMSYEDEEEDASESSDNDEVNSRQYSSEVCAMKAAGVAALSDPFCELGHEEQFYAVARFAKNDEFIFKTLMDPGATINIISPEVANRAALQRKQMAVNIFQGKRKQGSVEEMVQCAFELLGSNGTYVKHVEWFAVCDLGYDVLLGRRFCRLEGFTSFDEKLKKFVELPTRVESLNVSALESSKQTVTAKFDRVVAPAGSARYKRKAKTVVGVANAESSCVGEYLLHVDNELSSLLVLGKKEENGNNFVLLSFVVHTVNGVKSAKMQEWFKVTDGNAMSMSAAAIAKIMAAEKVAPTLLRVPKKRKLEPSDQRRASLDARKPGSEPALSPKLGCQEPPLSVNNTTVVADDDCVRGHHRETLLGTTKGLSVNSIPLTDSEVQERKLKISKLSKDVQRANEVKFASYHPVKGYRLYRNAERPPLRPQSNDHVGYLGNKRPSRDKRLQLKAAVEAAEVEYLCRSKQLAFQSMLSELKASGKECRGVSPDIDCWLQQLNEERVDVAAAEVDEASWSSEFKAGDYVEIRNAVIKPEFNGQRVRLHSKSTDDKFWVVRMLGKSGGKRRCSEAMFVKLSELEQQRSVPSSAAASFEDVGIDEAGQPNIELKQLAHRQFGEEYSEALSARIKLLKEQYPTVFTTDVTEPCLFEPMKIRLLPNAVLPSKARYYRNTPKMREEVRRQIQEQLEWGAIKKCVTPCVSDVLLVKRPHMPGKFRFVVSYIKLNDATVKEQLIMPDPKSQHERLAGKKIFGALDFSSYYRQIRLHEDSQYLTGFASDEGTFCYTRVPMGITGACAYAQKVLQDALIQDPILGPLGIRNYFDDLPFGADSEDEFMMVLEALLEFCVKWQLKVNPEKTVLGVRSITHVGFIVGENGIAIDPERTKDIAELTAPKSVKKVQSVLGVFNYVRNFIPDFSTKAKFLTDKLHSVIKKASEAAGPKAKKRKADVVAAPVAALSLGMSQAVKRKEKVLPKFEWTEDDGKQFEALKECVLKAPLLAHLNYELPIYIRCDASRFGAGAVLFQYDSRGYEHPVCYASRKFLASERNWSTFSQEASTVVWALERFAEYTQGYHTIVECDHRNISFVKKSAMPQLARWRLRLQDMDFTIRFLQGARNLTADGLSRQHVDDVEVTLRDVIPECSLPTDEQVLEEEIAALYSVEVSALYGAVNVAEFNTRYKRNKAVELEKGVLVKADNKESLLDDVEVELSYSSESDSECSACSETDDAVSMSEVGADDVLLNRFGANGELLDGHGQPIERAEQQPAHLVVPLLDADSEIQAVHNDLSGHAGTYVTLQRALKNGRSWGTRKQMLHDIDEFILKCACCQKMRKRSSHALVDRHVISGSPFSELSIDLLKLPSPDAFGMAYVVVVVDNFSHWTSLIAVRNKSAFEAARALVKVIGDFGAPMRLRSDGGAEFVNGTISGLLRMMGTTHHVVAPYTPTANGIVERANRAILERLREMIFSKRLVKHPEHVWSDLLPLVQRSINASVHSATGTSPAKILFGNNLDLDRCLLTHMPNARDLDVDRYVDALTYNQRIILEEADNHQARLCARVIAASHKAQRKRNKDGSFTDAVHKDIAIGDWVLVSPGPSYPLHKLAPRWLGPFRVLDCKTSSEVVCVEDTLKQKVRKFLRRQLEKFDVRMLADVEGLKTVAETDSFEFPVEAIIGHALVEEGGVGVAPQQLSAVFKRGQRAKKAFQFLIKWTGYDEPTWVEYKVASRLVQFPGYVSMLPNLRMD